MTPGARLASVLVALLMLAWLACCAALAFLSLGLIKLWFWMELKSNAIVREIKRVELQVAGLAAAVRETRPK